jgi:serine/threonine protein kinase
LDAFLQTSNQEISEEIVYYILNDLVQAIDYLTSKQIAHSAIVAENIILIESSQVNDNKVIQNYTRDPFELRKVSSEILKFPSKALKKNCLGGRKVYNTILHAKLQEILFLF